MRQKFLSLLAAVLLMLPATLKAQELKVVLSESFETGIPATWQNTTDRETGALWATESGASLVRPAGAAVGNSRAYLRNTTGKTIGFKTKLITPVLDLSGASNWVVRFRHAQVNRSINTDALRVYRRNSPTADWVLLAEYTAPISSWTQEMIPLPQVSATYQLAFEGVDNNAWGVVLDDVIVQEEPSCTTPHNLSVSELTATSAKLIWIASYDANNFQVVVFKGDALTGDALDSMDPSTALINKTTADGITFDMNLTGLEKGTKYTAYVRSNCDGEISDWGTITFSTRIVKDLPYTETFELAANSKMYVMDGWTHISNTGDISPVVPTNNTAKLVNDMYGKHAGTYALAFFNSPLTVNASNINAIPRDFINNATGQLMYMKPGQWSCAAAPEVNADLKDCQVRFWASVGAASGVGFAKTLKVGVMTDPNDITTFSQLTEIKMWAGPQENGWNEYIVSFADYAGSGKYVAFMSQADAPNVVFVDDVTIEAIPAVTKVTKQGLTYENGKVYLKWDAAKGATSYNVIIGTSATSNPAGLTGAKLLQKAEAVTETKLALATTLPAGEYAYAYVQAAGSGTAQWSNFFRFVVPAIKTPPMFFGFEESEGQAVRYQENYDMDFDVPASVATYSNDEYQFPYVSKKTKSYNVPLTGQYCLTTEDEDGYGMASGSMAWVVFPPVDRVDTLSMNFYLATQADYARVVVGVMEDPTDYYSFDPIATFTEMEGEYTRCNVSFADYTGKGHFIAIHIVPDPDMAMNKLANDPLIDDVTIGGLPECAIPQNVRMTSADNDGFTLQWDAAGGSFYELIVADKTMSDDELDAATCASIMARKQNIASRSLTLAYDAKLVQGKTYYAYVRSSCEQGGGKVSTSLWSAFAELQLPLPERFPLPYADDFESYPASSVPGGWNRLSTNNYDWVYKNGNANHTTGGGQGLYMYSSATTSSMANAGGYLSAPRFIIEDNDLNNLVINFWGKAASVQALTSNTVVIDTLYIGAMVNPNDETTFTQLTAVEVKTTTWEKYTVGISNWTPSLGEYITFTTRHGLYAGKNTNNNIYVDDIEFSSIVNGQPFDLAIDGINGDKATFSWTGKATAGWKVIVSTDNVTNASDLEGNNSVAFTTTVTTPTVQITGLAPQTHYFAYVKPVAADNEKWSSIEFLSECLKLNPKNTYIMDFEDWNDVVTASNKYADYIPDCWTSYNNVASAGVNYLPGAYVYAPNTQLTETSHVHSGRGSFYVYGQNASSGLLGPSVLVTPEIEGNVADWTVTVWGKPTSNSYKLHFGVMTDPNDISTFTRLGEEMYVGKQAWTKFKFNLAELGYQPSMGQYIAFRSPVDNNGTVVTGGFYLDELVLTTSKCTGPEITFSNLTNNSIAVRTAIEDGKVNMILVKDMNTLDLTKLNADVDAYLTSLGDKVVARRALSNSIGENLTGLSEATAYAIALQSTCSDGSASPWTISSFATMGAPKTPEEFGVYDFEDYAKSFGGETTAYNKTAISANGESTLMPGWARGNESRMGYWPLIFWNGTSTSATYQMAPAGKHCLHLASTSTYNGSYAIMPALNLPDDDIAKYRVTMKTRVSGNSTAIQQPTSSSYPKDETNANQLIVGLITDPANLSTFVALDTLKIPADGVSEQEVRFNTYVGDNNGNIGKHLMFRSFFSLPNYVYVDDIEFTRIPDCVGPVSFKKLGVTESSVELTWKSMTPAVRVMLATEPVEEGARMSYFSYVYNKEVNGSKVVINDLKPNTMYYAYVMSECGGKQYWGNNSLTVTTACGAAQQLPYYENFDNYTPPTSNNNMKPNCWMTYYNNLAQTSTSTRYPQILAGAKYGTTGNGLNMYATKNNYKTKELRATGVTPAIEGDISRAMISFRYRNGQASNTNPAMMLVALTKDRSSIANIYKDGNFFVVDTIRLEAASNGNVWYEYRKELSAFSGENMYIVLSALNEVVDGIQYYNPIYIDDFAVEEIPTCFTPSNLSVTDIRPESVVLHFDAYRAEDKKWDVAVVEQGTFDIVPVSYDTTDIVLTNLKPLTSYSVLVRTNCADDDQSAYVQTSFTTLDKISADRYFGFENDEEAVRTPGASTDAFMLSRSLTAGSFDADGNPLVNAAYNPYNAAGNQRTGERALQLTNSSTYLNAYVVLPEIADAATKQIRFDMRAANTAANIATTQTAPFAVLEIGTVPAYGDVADFTPLAAYKASAYMAGESMTEEKNLLYDQVVMQLPDLTGKQLALRLATPESYMYIDNLYIEAGKGFNTPAIIGNSTITPTTLTFSWEAKADTKWNVYLTDDADIFPLDVEKAVKKVEATELTTVNFEGLTPDKQYFAFLQVAGQTETAAVSARRAYKTPSDIVKLPLNTTIDFEDGLVPAYEESDARKTIYGLTTGNTMSTARSTIPYVITDLDTASYSLSGNHALVMPNTSKYGVAYAVAPLIASDRLDTLQVNFRGRIFTAVKGKAEGSTTDAPFLPITVGTVTDPNDIMTFEPIAKLYYGNTKVTYESDAATGDKLFEKFSFRLAGAKGEYVAFVFDTIGTWYIDDLEIGPKTCIAPVNLTTIEAGIDAATIAWAAFDDGFVQVQVSSDEAFTAENIVKDETLRGDTCTAEGLASGVTYYWRVRQVCSDTENSDWSNVATFNTVCKAGTTYATSFEAADGWLPVNPRETGADALLKPFCWIVGYSGATAAKTEFTPYVAVNNGGSVWYSHDDGSRTNKAALRLMSAWERETYYQTRGPQRAWAIMPEIDADLNDMEVSFWMSPATYNVNTEAVATAYVGGNYNYVGSIIVGTVTDPNDISTFQPLEVVRYDGDSLYAGLTANADNNFRFIKYTVQLKGATGKYVAFVSDSYAFRENYPWLTDRIHNVVFIDDVEVVPASGCVTPGKRETLNVNTTTALLRWQGTEGANFRVTVASDASFSESTIVARDTVSEMQYSVTGLLPSTRYYWRVAQFCGEDGASAESPAVQFITLRAPFFYENFEECGPGHRTPAEWSSVTMPASEVFKGKKLPTTQDYANGWGSVSGSNTITHMTTKLNSTPNSGDGIDYVYAWLVSPSFKLGEDLPAWLSFNVSVNYMPSGGLVSYDPYQTNGYDDQFMVIISDDNGQTWKRENATVWNNETDTSSVHFYGNGDYSFNSLPSAIPNFGSDADRIFIDLAKYKGKDIKIAFYAETTVPNARNRMRLWDVRLAYYYSDVAEYEKCRYEEDYEWRGFTVNSTMPNGVEAGSKTLETISYAPMSRLAADPTNAMVDTVYTLNATVWDIAETVYEREICEGYAYSDDNFENLTEARDYSMHLSTVNGCDSLITLRLTVRPRLYSEKYDTLCVGQVFSLNGIDYTENTVVYDTIRQVGAEFGCDSVVKHVVVFEAMTPYEYDAQSCHGVPYYFTAKYPALTVEGRYIDTVKTADLCDSVVIVNLTFPERITYTEELFFCPGGSVTYEGKTYSEETDDVIILTDATGCETEVTVKVRAAQTYNIVIDAKICEGNAYTLNGFNETEPGQYTHTGVSAQGCDSITVLNLSWYDGDPVMVDDTITVDELPYNFSYLGVPVPGITYPKGTEPGVYNDTAMVNNEGGCEIQIIHKLTVIPATGLQTVERTLLITPNYISRGESVSISGFEVWEGMKVEVYDMTGKRVSANDVTMAPVQVDGFHAAGIYTVRLLTADGAVFTGRVIVR